MSRFDPNDNIGMQPRWRIVLYLIRIGSWRKAFRAALGAQP